MLKVLGEKSDFFDFMWSSHKNSMIMCRAKNHISPLLISCILYFSQKFLLCQWNLNTFVPRNFKEIVKTSKIIMVKCDEIWFPWRNIVLCSIFNLIIYKESLRCTNIVFVSVTIAESRHIGRSERWMHPVPRFGGNNYPIKCLYDNDFFHGM